MMAFSMASSSLPLPTTKVSPSSCRTGGRHPAARTQPSSLRMVSMRGASPSSTSSSSSSSSSSEVYVAAIPLVGLEAMGAVLGDRYPDRLEHTMVLVRHRGITRTGGGRSGTHVVTAYDFLPIDPLSPFTAARLASGGCVPGDLRIRSLRGLPSRRCWKVGDVAPTIGWSSSSSSKSSDGARARNEDDTSDDDDDDHDCWQSSSVVVPVPVAEVDALDEDEDDDERERERIRLLRRRQMCIDDACLRFQREYDANLSLARNSCREHTIAMAAYLTGVSATDVKMPESIFSQ